MLEFESAPSLENMSKEKTEAMERFIFELDRVLPHKKLEKEYYDKSLKFIS